MQTVAIPDDESHRPSDWLVQRNVRIIVVDDATEGHRSRAHNADKRISRPAKRLPPKLVVDARWNVSVQQRLPTSGGHRVFLFRELPQSYWPAFIRRFDLLENLSCIAFATMNDHFIHREANPVWLHVESACGAYQDLKERHPPETEVCDRRVGVVELEDRKEILAAVRADRSAPDTKDGSSTLMW